MFRRSHFGLTLCVKNVGQILSLTIVGVNGCNFYILISAIKDSSIFGRKVGGTLIGVADATM